MILYMDVRYEGTSGELDLSVIDAVNTSPAPQHGRLSTLLDWHEQDPPDAFEINRNNVVYSYQGNRNPFIDHPEFVGYIWNPTANVQETNVMDVGFYPNPVTDRLNVNLMSSSSECTLEIVNMMGEKVERISIDGRGSSQLDCSNLPAGLYLLRISDEQSGNHYVSTFVKN
jgi:hypothetical protein